MSITLVTEKNKLYYYFMINKSEEFENAKNFQAFFLIKCAIHNKSSEQIDEYIYYIERKCRNVNKTYDRKLDNN